MHKAAASPGKNAAMPDWDDVRYAVVVARCGSLAAAARQLGVDQTTVARRLRALETCVGTPLFERAKGLLTPTAAGGMLLERGLRMEREAAALSHLAADGEVEVGGTVRITAVDALSHYLAKHLAELRGRHPALAVELIGSSRSLDLTRREADLAVRLARPQDGDLVVRRLGSLAYGIYGPCGEAPPAAWQDARWVAYERSLAAVPEMRWLAEMAGETGDERITFRCNNMDALATAVADGLGLAILPRFVGDGREAISCLSGTEPILRRDLWLVLPRELRDIPRIRAAADWLAQRFERDAGYFDPT
jgi:DNA-binding transcriptional LysR family regulator